MLDNVEVSKEAAPVAKLVLVVEDDSSIGELIIEAVQCESQYRASLVTNGFEMLKFIRHVKPDLFLLDYQLPQMNGIELYDYLQKINALKGVPTLFMSANPPLQELQMRHLRCIRKPFELDELLSAIQQSIG